MRLYTVVTLNVYGQFKNYRKCSWKQIWCVLTIMFYPLNTGLINPLHSHRPPDNVVSIEYRMLNTGLINPLHILFLSICPASSSGRRRAQPWWCRRGGFTWAFTMAGPSSRSPRCWSCSLSRQGDPVDLTAASGVPEGGISGMWPQWANCSPPHAHPWP